MVRIQGWESALYDAVEYARARPFEWGVHDCALFAAGVVERLTGQDIAAPYRGYKTERGALSRIVKAGGMEAMATRALGEPIDIKRAGRGDFVLVESDAPWPGAFAIVLDTRAAAAGMDGVTFVPMKLWRMAWRVG
jgi:hypothetical protein